MLLAARKVCRYIEGLTQEAFVRSDLHQSAIIRELQVIGEASRQVTPDYKARYTGIDWVKISGMRNRLVHEYFRLNLRIIWEVATKEMQALITELEQIVPKDDVTEGE